MLRQLLVRVLTRSLLGAAVPAGAAACGTGSPGLSAQCDDPGLSDRAAPVSAGLGVALAADEDSALGEAEKLESVFVAVSGVAAHGNGSQWSVVTEEPVLVDLLHLTDAPGILGFAALLDGRINQVRLYLADDGQTHVVTNGGEARRLALPDSIKNGVKLKGPFDLGPCTFGTATAVLDLQKSIKAQGHDKELTLNPVVRRINYSALQADRCTPGAATPDGADDSAVDDGDTCAPVADEDGVLVDSCTGQAI